MKLDNIELDTSIQCRAAIDMITVAHYAERMQEGDKFEPVILYGTKQQAWIGDGWHRIMAAQQIGAVDIDAVVTAGGRIDALRCALGANGRHGLRRSNADKRRAVELAIAEFADMSDGKLAEICAVDPKTIAGARPVNSGNSRVETRTGKDGKKRAVKPKVPPPAEPHETTATTPSPPVAPAKPTAPMPVDPQRTQDVPPGLDEFTARERVDMAIGCLEQIAADDPDRIEQLERLADWIDAHSV